MAAPAIGTRPRGVQDALPDDVRDQQKEIGIAGRLAGGGQHRMGLPAMVGLVIEEMRHQQPLFGGYLTIGRTAEPGQVLGEPGIVDLVGPARDARIGLLAFGPQLGPRSSRRFV